MHVFVTGGTGLIGSTVIPELVQSGHSVTALSRSDASDERARTLGAEPIRGALTDLSTIRTAAEDSEGVVHLAFSNDFSSPEALNRSIVEETAALNALCDALDGSGRPLVTASGTPVADGRASVESDPLTADGPVGGRMRTVTEVLDGAGSRGIRAASVRLPRTVHNNGDGGFAGILASLARQSGVVSYPGNGSQRWPAVHALDAAALFRLVLESAPAGTAWHAVDDEGVTVGDIVEVIGRRLGLPTKQAPEETFGPLGRIFAADQPAASAYTRTTLGWEPTHTRLLDDLQNLQP